LRETAQALEKEILDVFSCETEVALVCESIIEPSDYEYLKVASIQVSLQDEVSDTQKERIKAYLMEAYGSEVYIE
jgi:hypothetical protein